jgi:hypothetical protein
MRHEHAKAMLIPVAQQNIESLVSGDRVAGAIFSDIHHLGITIEPHHFAAVSLGELA